ncbi:unnamed protein product [Ceutorhynchus assimilis]|uniref:Uncharacterized protein n=1 Tax=Ceutorhynchus assimilis TaxID=467358 RepID=A0A9N9MLB8_9CUCU|nr:unnamed protein product [Ceutorhynchus assimilis]
MFKIKQLLPLCSNCFKKTKFNFQRFASHQKEPTTNTDYDDGPIKFSTSRAIAYKAKTTRTGIEAVRLWYEPYVLILSVGVFLLYFCILREENDIDKDLSRNLYSRIEGLEELQLRASLKYNLTNGLDVIDIRNRLEEIEEEKLKVATSK